MDQNEGGNAAPTIPTEDAELAALLFLNPIFEAPGKTMATVRRGTKWAALEIGQAISLRDKMGENRELARATVIDTFTCPLIDVPESALAMDQDKPGRSRSDLAAALAGFYTGISPFEDVTIVGFSIDEPASDGADAPTGEVDSAGGAGDAEGVDDN